MDEIKICRICLEEIEENNQSFLLNNDELLQLKLLDFLPEINLSLTPNPIVCLRCMTSIDEIYEFKQLCIRTENTIKSLEQQQIPFKDVLRYAKPDVVDEEEDDDDLWKMVKRIKTEDIVIKEEFEEEFEEDEFEEDEESINCDLHYLEEFLQENDDPLECVENSAKIEIYYCYDCKYSTKNKNFLSRHVYKHHGKGLPREGSRKSSRKTVVNASIEKKTINWTEIKKQFNCNFCDYKTNTKKGLNVHIRTIHSNAGFGDHVYARRQEEIFQCIMCSYHCKNAKKFQEHLFKHSGMKQFRCRFCSYRSNQALYFKAHLRKHSTDKPFKCSACDYNTFRKGWLNKHLKKHTEMNVLNCSICNFQCYELRPYQLHLRTHTDESPFNCVICDFNTCNKQNLLDHIRTHI